MEFSTLSDLLSIKSNSRAGTNSVGQCGCTQSANCVPQCGCQISNNVKQCGCS